MWRATLKRAPPVPPVCCPPNLQRPLLDMHAALRGHANSRKYFRNARKDCTFSFCAIWNSTIVADNEEMSVLPKRRPQKRQRTLKIRSEESEQLMSMAPSVICRELRVPWDGKHLAWHHGHCRAVVDPLRPDRCLAQPITTAHTAHSRISSGGDDGL